jgi:hypothetical protein
LRFGNAVNCEFAFQSFVVADVADIQQTFAGFRIPKSCDVFPIFIVRARHFPRSQFFSLLIERENKGDIARIIMRPENAFLAF